jgi:hypothetical protein
MKGAAVRLSAVAAALCVALVFGCVSPYEGTPEDGSGLPGTGTVTAVSDLFSSGGESPGNGERVTRFYTNDGKYRAPSGYTLWTAGDGGAGTPFTSRTVAVRKPYGNGGAGYGVVFCEAPRTAGGTTERVYLTVLINNKGEYAVGKVRGADFRALVWWTGSTRLVSGPGMTNTITVVRDGTEGNKYHLFLNDGPQAEEVTAFVDEGEPYCNGVGRNGYIVVIAPGDLDKAGVEVFFTE